MKNRIYRFLRKITKTPEWAVPPNWVYKIGILMFGNPQKIGGVLYNWESDMFEFNGIKITRQAIVSLTQMNGVYKLESENGVVTITKVNGS
jgi:hypothetical protein